MGEAGSLHCASRMLCSGLHIHTCTDTCTHACSCMQTPTHTSHPALDRPVHAPWARGQACPMIRGPRGPASMQHSLGSISLICSQAHLSCQMERLSQTPDSLRLSAPHPPWGEAASGSPGPAALSGGSSQHPSWGRCQRGRGRPCHAPWWLGSVLPRRCWGHLVDVAGTYECDRRGQMRPAWTAVAGVDRCSRCGQMWLACISEAGVDSQLPFSPGDDPRLSGGRISSATGFPEPSFPEQKGVSRWPAAPACTWSSSCPSGGLPANCGLACHLPPQPPIAGDIHVSVYLSAYLSVIHRLTYTFSGGL